MFAQVSDYGRGLDLIRNGQPAEAAKLLGRVTAVQPADAHAWEALGIAYATQGIYAQAADAFHRACQLNAKLEDACYYEGSAQYALERFEDALTALKRAPESWKVHLTSGKCLDALGKATLAEQELRTAGIHPEALEALAKFLLKHGRADEALALSTEMLARFPDSTELHLTAGRALLEAGDAAAALPNLRAAGNSAEAQLLLGKALVRTGRTNEAQRYFTAAAALEQAK